MSVLAPSTGSADWHSADWRAAYNVTDPHPDPVVTEPRATRLGRYSLESAPVFYTYGCSDPRLRPVLAD